MLHFFSNAYSINKVLSFPPLYRIATSILSIEYALEKKWNIKYLISVKPNRTDCYLFHFATVEQTKNMVDILGIKHVYAACSDADPQKEAIIIKEIVEQHPVDSVILGGIGLQETQINSKI